MKTRTVILAGGAGARMGVLTAKRTKPAVPFAGRYRLFDFPLSNCVNSDLFDVVIVAQYRPHSLIDHIRAGAPWDLDRDFTGGVNIYTPYTARYTGWYSGTADAIQQNFGFIKSNKPDLILILSGDHIYAMNYEKMIEYHTSKQADVTIATVEVPVEEAHRFGIVGTDELGQVTSFVEKPANPLSNQVNMGVYLFNCRVLDLALWEDNKNQDSSHDFGKDILPALVNTGAHIFAYPNKSYWVDVGTVNSYWQAHMDVLDPNPPFTLHDPSWVIHTRTEERPPIAIRPGAYFENSFLCEGCVIEGSTRIVRSVLSPGVHVKAGAQIYESIILTDTVIHENAVVRRSILDKRVNIGEGSQVGEVLPDRLELAMIGKNSVIPPKTVIEAGGVIWVDVIPSDLPGSVIKASDHIQTQRSPYEI